MMTRLAAFVAPRTLAAMAARTFACRNALNMSSKARALSSGSRNDPAIMAAIDKEREKRLAAKPPKFERSLTETLSDHRDALLNIVLAALLVILTLKMLREKGEKLDIESEREKRIKILEAELVSLEFAVVESVRTGLPKVGLGWGGSRTELERQVLQLVRNGMAAAKDRQGNFEKAQVAEKDPLKTQIAAPNVLPAQGATAPAPDVPTPKRGMV